jgi:hypothetical protein
VTHTKMRAPARDRETGAAAAAEIRTEVTVEGNVSGQLAVGSNICKCGSTEWTATSSTCFPREAARA